MPLNDITPLLEKARTQALARQAHVLVSASRRIAPVDPLAALANVVRLATSDDRISGHVAEGCFYWTRQADEFSFAGVGAAVSLEPSGPDRFKSAERAWASLLEGAIIEDGGEGANAPGPLLAGGFAFQEDGPRSLAWKDFPSARLTVPRVLVVSDGGQAWVTTTMLVGPDGTIDSDPDSVEAVEDALLASGFSIAPAAPPASDHSMQYHEPRPRSRWHDVVELAVEEIGKGNLEKVVLARELHASAPRALDVVSILHHLREAHRDSFVFACWRGDRVFLGATPERLVRLDGRNVLASSLAGTIRRGSTSDEDSANARTLLASAKDRAEHAAVRSALEDALAEFCDTLKAPAEPALLTLPHVHHLHTLFRGHLKEGASLLGLVGRLHPTPAVGGSPRAAALAFIDIHEQLDRGWYAAPIGWIGRHGGEFAVALRSALVAGSRATLFAGCGIVAGSDPGLEYDESSLKMRSMQSALETAMSGSGEAVALAGEPQHIPV